VLIDIVTMKYQNINIKYVPVIVLKLLHSGTFFYKSI